MLRQVVDNRWFSFFDLACAVVSGIIWFFWSQFGWQPLLIALLPWFLRLGAGQFPFKRTSFDLPLIIFLLTAAVGAWVSYDPPAAWAKFWLIVGSVLIYYALVAQPGSNLPGIYGLLGVVGAAVALSVLFDANLTYYNPDLNSVRRFSQFWEGIRPPWRVDALPPNVSGGILAVLLTFPFITASESFRNRKLVVAVIALALVALMAVALFLSSSRGAWIALSIAWLIVLGWVAGRMAWPYLSRTFRIFIPAALLGSLVVAFGLVITGSGGLAAAMDRVPGLPSGASRVDLALDTINLSADFPFTGGGLNAFPGLYSKYILIIPYLFFEYSHNLYLDVYLEQGFLAILVLMVVLIGSLFVVVNGLLSNGDGKSGMPLQLAVLAGLVVLMVHGLVDDALYGMRGTPLLLIIPGISVALRYANTSNSMVDRGRVRFTRRSLLGGSALVVFLGVTAFVLMSQKPIVAAWYANLGSIQMAKAELYDFPSNSFDYLPNEGPLEQAKAYFSRALAADPQNITANYRLGMIASQETDFMAAIPYLERAFLGNDRHRGIQKLLGYNYAWTGQPDLAAEMLAEIPEARQELEAYIWWWGTKQRPDLAAYSEATLKQLAFHQ
jgi:hypothetical protein